MNAQGLMAQRRFGRFRIPLDFIDREANAVRAVFACCIAVRAEHLLDRGELEVVALSPQFEPVDLGEITPEYHWIITVAEPLGQLTASAELKYDGPISSLHI